MIDIDPDSLIDRELIAAAQEKLRAATARQHDATAALAIARQKVKDLENASRLAIEGRNKISPLDAERALTEAAMELRVAEKTEVAASNFLKKCEEWVTLARGAAHSGVYLFGLRGRIAALKKAEAARALMAAAQADMEAAASMCHRAHVNGHPHIHGLGNRPALVSVSEAEERAVIAAAGVDLETGEYPWLQHVKSSEPA